MGGLSHARWRRSGMPFAAEEMAFCVDGDMVELFLEVNADVKETVVAKVNAALGRQFSVKEMTDYVQDIRIKNWGVCWRVSY